MGWDLGEFAKSTEWATVPQFIGRSPSAKQAWAVVVRIRNRSDHVNLEGETGTGKEVIARSLHFTSKRAESGRFVPVNCAAIPPTMEDAELFGYEKGSYTSSVYGKAGFLEQAHRGTLFLDEIAELSLTAQAKFLRASEDHNVERLGGRKRIHTDFRLIVASQFSLNKLMRQGKLRPDLYYRLKGITIRLSPLRERVEDIPLLWKHFEGMYRMEGDEPLCLTEEALRALQAYSWPGNVREVEHEVTRLLASQYPKKLPLSMLTEEIRKEWGDRKQRKAKTSRHKVGRRKEASKALDRADGNISKAARLIGVNRRTLYRWLSKNGKTD